MCRQDWVGMEGYLQVGSQEDQEACQKRAKAGGRIEGCVDLLDNGHRQRASG